ncbi:MAG: aminoacyl-tRNA hydrolase [Clostridia bacterium]|nr:aminoacyl-tRNA hydrolase [Clostridia bacterium]
MFFKNKNCVYSYLVVCLGNPGKEYENTRHNAGFKVADVLEKDFAKSDFKLKHKALICECAINGGRVLLAKPQTYMNLSGEAVSEICKFYKIQVNNVIVVFDDISLPVGKIRVRGKGTHGGHNGMKNISEHLKTTDIIRVKVGVGQKPNTEYDLKDWVLGKFSKEDNEVLNKAFKKAADATVEIIKNGTQSAMNKFNN